MLVIEILAGVKRTGAIPKRTNIKSYDKRNKSHTTFANLRRHWIYASGFLFMFAIFSFCLLMRQKRKWKFPFNVK